MNQFREGSKIKEINEIQKNDVEQNTPEVLWYLQKGYIEKFLKDPERSKIFFDLVESQLEWVENELGISVRNNMPNFDKVFAQKDQSSFALAYRKTKSLLSSSDELESALDGGEMLTGLGRATKKGEIVLNKKSLSNPDSLKHTLAHEVTHSLSANKNGERSGFVSMSDSEDDSFSGLNEYITESITLEMLRHERSKIPGENNNKESGIVGYEPGILFLDTLLDAADKRILPTSSSSNKKTMYKAYFKGDPQPLNFFDDIFGEGTVDSLSKISQKADVADLYMFLYSKDPSAAEAFKEKCKLWKKGSEIQLKNGVIFSGQQSAA